MATSLRIIPSEEEASLHPRAIWNHWKKNVIWDPRSYYGVLEFSGIVVCFLTLPDLNYHGRDSYFWSGLLKLLSSSLLVVPIAALHWYSNHRQSTNILTRSRTHIVVLLAVALLLFFLQMISVKGCVFNCQVGVGGHTHTIIWFSIFVLLGALFVVYRNARNPRKDPVLAELPSPTIYTSAYGYDYPEDDSQRVWAETTTVADGIEDDSVEVEGQVRL